MRVHAFYIGFPEGVMKSVMGELTDSTNRAEGFALMPVVWASGATLGYHILSILGLARC